jgi:thiamine-monophosphate kinase
LKRSKAAPALTLPREFDLIERHFRPLAGPAARGLADDAAVLDIPPGRQLVISADAMNEGVHYFSGTDPALLARKLLRVNLSDLAAMGATPLGYLLTLALPATTAECWFEAFAAGLCQDQQAFGLALLGGDSTSIDGPACLGLTILGTVARGDAIPRNGARPGDGIWVTGTIGDGALGLAALRGELSDPGGELAARYYLPTPRLGVADGIARAAIDVSDGLFAELAHLCRGGNLAADIQAEAIPLSRAAQHAGRDWRGIAQQGGDDYELVLAVAPEQEPLLRVRAAALDVPVTRIGYFRAGPAMLHLDGIAIDAQGWSHFRAAR